MRGPKDEPVCMGGQDGLDSYKNMGKSTGP